MFVDESVLCTSTIGAAALTVIVSLADCCIVTATFAVWPTSSVRFCAFTGAKPSSAKET